MNAPLDRNTFDGKFDVAAFPCNQFELQEPGHNDEILNGIKYVRPGGGYQPSFTIYAKLEVNGYNEHPLYTYLKVNIISYVGGGQRKCIFQIMETCI